jgi:hypothetical protein
LYYAYQPILAGVITNDSFVNNLEKIEAWVFFLVPPISGLLADVKGRGFGFFAFGIFLAAMVFMVAASVFITKPAWQGEALPALITIWLIAMALFYTPALSLIERLIPPVYWVYGFAALAVVTELVYASAYWFKQAFLALPPGFLFALAGTLIAIFAWRLVKQPLLENAPEKPVTKNPATWFLFIFFSGLIVGIILQWLGLQADDESPQLLSMTFLIASAMLLPAILFGQFIGYRPTWLLGLAAFVFGLVLWLLELPLMIISLLIALALMQVTALPWLFSRFPLGRRALPTGVWLMGIATSKLWLAYLS